MYFMLELVEQRKVREAHHNLSTLYLACQGSPASVRKQLAALKKQMK